MASEYSPGASEAMARAVSFLIGMSAGLELSAGRNLGPTWGQGSIIS
jgi:hypothetical protein